jgi:hypothetical protein
VLGLNMPCARNAMDPGMGEAFQTLSITACITILSIEGLTALRRVWGSSDWLFA